MLDQYPDLDPEAGEVLTEELHASDDVLVKAFALGPDAEIEPHEHEGDQRLPRPEGQRRRDS